MSALAVLVSHLQNIIVNSKKLGVPWSPNDREWPPGATSVVEPSDWLNGSK